MCLSSAERLPGGAKGAQTTLASFDVAKVRDVPPYVLMPTAGVVGLSEAINRLLLYTSVYDSSGVDVIALRGPRGAGKSTLLQRLQYLTETVAFQERKPGFRSVFGKVCSECTYCEFAAADMHELYTRPADDGGATTQSGAHTIRSGEACCKCKAATAVHAFTIADEEVAQLKHMLTLHQEPTVSTTVIQCSHCGVTGFPMTQEGLCVNHSGTLMSVTGQQMPPVGSPCWTSSLPMLSPQCKQGVRCG